MDQPDLNKNAIDLSKLGEAVDEAEPETRVVLVKPGDLLIFGNVGPVTQETVELIGQALMVRLGVMTLLFEADIDMAAIPRDRL